MAEHGALVGGGEEGGSVVAWSAFVGGGIHGDEGGQVFVVAAQAVADPGTHRRADQVGGAGVEEEGGGTVGNALGVHAVDETEIIDVPGDFGEQGGGPAPALAVSGKFPERLEDFAFLDFPGAGDPEFDFLAVGGDEIGLVVEGIDLARATLHEKENHAAHPGDRSARREGEGPGGSGRGPAGLTENSGGGQGSEATGGVL